MTITALQYISQPSHKCIKGWILKETVHEFVKTSQQIWLSQQILTLEVACEMAQCMMYYCFV